MKQKYHFLAAAAALFALVFFTTCATIPASLGKADSGIPFNPAVRSGTLPNGLTYFLLENKKPENRVNLTLAVKAGSIDEEDDERGLAHFVEHMAFNGTERFPEFQLIEYLRSLGMRFGADANAYTDYDETVYMIEVPSEGRLGSKVVPDKALDILDDWSRSLLITEKDTNEERPIILEEKRARTGANSRIMETLRPILFHDSKYAGREPIGQTEIIENASAAALRGFYEKWYRPDNMALIITGDFDAPVLENELAKHFNAKKNETPFNKPVYELPPPEKGRFTAAVITDSELSAANVSVYYKRRPKEPSKTIAEYRDDIIESLVFTILNNRFAELGLEPETNFTYAGAWNQIYFTKNRFVVFAAASKEGKLKDALREILTEKERAYKYGFTKDEIERVKKELMSNVEQAAREKDKIESSSLNDELLNYYLAGGAVPEIDWEEKALKAILPGISASQLSKAFKAMFEDDDISVFVIANDKESETLPSEAEIAAAFSEIKDAKIERPSNKKEKSVLLDSPPVPGIILNKTIDEETQTVILELENGARVLLKPTNNKNDEILLFAGAKGGYTAANEAEQISARFASDLLNVSGAGKYSLMEIMKKLSGKQASLSFNAGAFDRSISGASSVKDTETLFELLYLSMTEPRFDDKAIKAYLERVKTSLKQKDNSPEQYFYDELMKALRPGNPNFWPMQLSDVDKLNKDEAWNFAELLRNPADWTFVFIGNIDIDLLTRYIETYIASIPNTENSLNSYADISLSRPSASNKTIYKGKENKAVIYAGYFAEEKNPEQKTQLISSILGEYLEIVFTNVIREKMGGAYSVGAFASTDFIPKGETSLQITLQCDPARIKEITNAAQSELKKAASGNIDTDIFNKAQLALIAELELGMQNNSYIGQRYLNYAAFFGWPLSALAGKDALVKEITPADIAAMAKKLDANGAFVYVLEPEKK